MGRLKSSSKKPTPRSMARFGARPIPSVVRRLWRLSSDSMGINSLTHLVIHERERVGVRSRFLILILLLLLLFWRPVRIAGPLTAKSRVPAQHAPPVQSLPGRPPYAGQSA